MSDIQLLYGEAEALSMGGGGGFGSMTPPVLHSADSSANWTTSEHYRFVLRNQHTDLGWSFDSAGNYRPQPHNLLLSHRDMSRGGWAATRGVLVGEGDGDPFGGDEGTWFSYNAERDVEKYVEQSVSVVSGATYVFSVYTTTFFGPGDGAEELVCLEAVSGLTTDRTFIDVREDDLAVETGPGGFVDLGNGWLRIWVRHQAADATVRLRIYPNTTSASDQETREIGTSGDFFGPALTETPEMVAWAASDDGLRAYYGPRESHTGASPYVARGLLLERATINLLRQSVVFDDAEWTKYGMTVAVADYGGSPDGSQRDMIEISALQTHQIRSQTTSALTANRRACVRIRARAGNRDWLRVECRNASTSFHRAYFNISAGALGTTTNLVDASITALDGGWYDCLMRFETASGGNFYVTLAGTAGNNGSNRFIGVSTATAYSLAVAQFETGEVPTEYLPTYGLTRARNTDDIRISRRSSLRDGAVQIEYARDNNNSASNDPLIYSQVGNNVLYTQGANSLVTSDGGRMITSTQGDNDDFANTTVLAVNWSGDMMEHVMGGMVIARGAFDGKLPGSESDGYGLTSVEGVTRIERMLIWDTSPGEALLEADTGPVRTVSHDFGTGTDAPAWLATNSTEPGYVYSPTGVYGTVPHNLFDQAENAVGGSWVSSGGLISTAGVADPVGGSGAVVHSNGIRSSGALAGTLTYAFPTTSLHPGGEITLSVNALRIGSNGYIGLGIRNTATPAEQIVGYFSTTGRVNRIQQWGAYGLVRSNVVANDPNWVYIQATFTAPPDAQIEVICYPAVSDTTGTNTYSSFNQVLWRWQFERRSHAGEWLGADHIEPRIDWSPIRMPSGGALLCYGRREQKLGYTENPLSGGSIWSAVAGSIRENRLVRFGHSFHQFLDTLANTQHRIDIASSGITAGWWTFSCIVRKITTTGYLTVRFGNSSEHGTIELAPDGTFIVSTSSSSVASGTATLIEVLPRHLWYVRISVNKASAAALVASITTHDISTSLSYAGRGTSRFYIGGAQVEAGRFTSNPIPTWDAGPRMHVDDGHVAMIADYIGAAEGTIITWGRFRELVSRGRQYVFQLRINNGSVIELFLNNSGPLRLSAIVGGTRQFTLTSTVTPVVHQQYRLAVAWAVDDYRLTIDSATWHYTNSAAVPPVRDLHIGHSRGQNEMRGEIDAIRIYDRRLLEAEILATPGVV